MRRGCGRVQEILVTIRVAAGRRNHLLCIRGERGKEAREGVRETSKEGRLKSDGRQRMLTII